MDGRSLRRSGRRRAGDPAVVCRCLRAVTAVHGLGADAAWGMLEQTAPFTPQAGALPCPALHMQAGMRPIARWTSADSQPELGPAWDPYTAAASPTMLAQFWPHLMSALATEEQDEPLEHSKGTPQQPAFVPGSDAGAPGAVGWRPCAQIWAAWRAGTCLRTPGLPGVLRCLWGLEPSECGRAGLAGLLWGVWGSCTCRLSRSCMLPGWSRELGGEKARHWHASAGCCRLADTSGLQDVKKICEAGLQDHQSDVATENQHLRPVRVRARLVCAEPALTHVLSTIQPRAWPPVACSPLGGLP